MNLVIFAIPAFLLLIVTEFILAKFKNRRVYSLNDTVCSIHIGILNQFVFFTKKALHFSIYAIFFDSFSLVTLGTDTWVWVFSFIAYDFCYYWMHRYSHEINLLWAAHVVHHQSEEFNLSTALRQTSGSVFGFIFFLPLALLGIEPIILISVSSLNLIYQFWVHTKLINKLPSWIEYLFVTPSHHRVHHGSNRIYLDKNHGGVFILWDRWFGTFQTELEQQPVKYGVTVPLNSWNPLWANIVVYWGLIKDTYLTRSWKDKVAIWFKRTGWRPNDVKHKFAGNSVKVETRTLNNVEKGYVFYQHLLTLTISLILISIAMSLAFNKLLVITFVIVFGLISLSLYQSGRRYAWFWEMLKHLCLIALLSNITEVNDVLINISYFGIYLGLILLSITQLPMLKQSVFQKRFPQRD